MAQKRVPQGPFRPSHTEGLLTRSVEDTYYKWPSCDYVMPSSLPTHDKIDVAVGKVFELVDHYKSLTKRAVGAIRDPCINILYKVTGDDFPRYWTSVGNFRDSPRDLLKKISDSLT